MNRLRKMASGPQDIIPVVNNFEKITENFAVEVTRFINDFESWMNNNKSSWSDNQYVEIDGIKYEMNKLIEKLKYIDETFNSTVTEPLKEAASKWDSLIDEN